MSKTTINTGLTAFLSLLLCIFWFFISTCGDLNKGPNEKYHLRYGENGGYESCFVCHPMVKVHLNNPTLNLDLNHIREIIDQQGVHSCQTCHYNDDP